MRIAIFGTGEYSSIYSSCIPKEMIAYYLDNNSLKWGHLFNERPVKSPDDIDYAEMDYVVIMVFRGEYIAEQIIGLGMPKERVIQYYELADILNLPLNLHNRGEIIDSESWINSSPKKRIFLCSHDFSRTGVPVASMHLSKLLIKEGYDVVFGALRNGTLEEDLDIEGIVYIDNLGIYETSRRFRNFLEAFDAVVFGTIAVGRFANVTIDYMKPVFFWIHESYDKYFKKHILPEDKSNYFYLLEGDKSDAMFKKYYPQRHTERMLYYLPDKDLCVQTTKIGHEKTVFLLAGSVSRRKGQDVFVNALKFIPQQVKQYMKFIVVGLDMGELEIDWNAVREDGNDLVYIEELSQIELEQLYNEVDVLLCPSREDSDPIVVTQAFQHRIPCIISDGVGQSRFMENNKGGYVFANENSEMLASYMQNIVTEDEAMLSKADEARDIFDMYFSEKAIKSIVDEKILARI